MPNSDHFTFFSVVRVPTSKQCQLILGGSSRGCYTRKYSIIITIIKAFIVVCILYTYGINSSCFISTEPTENIGKAHFFLKFSTRFRIFPLKPRRSLWSTGYSTRFLKRCKQINKCSAWLTPSISVYFDWLIDLIDSVSLKKWTNDDWIVSIQFSSLWICWHIWRTPNFHLWGR